ncbi:MAG: hypothetical protein IJ784_13685 [Ruminiclostridium sp.]|nr:hypothetical protein [Ruminiclostridium sp.]
MENISYIRYINSDPPSLVYKNAIELQNFSPVAVRIEDGLLSIFKPRSLEDLPAGTAIFESTADPAFSSLIMEYMYMQTAGCLALKNVRGEYVDLRLDINRDNKITPELDLPRNRLAGKDLIGFFAGSGEYNDRSYQKEAGEYVSLLNSIRSELTQLREDGDTVGALSCDILGRVERLIEIVCEKEFRSGCELGSRTAIRSCTSAVSRGLKLPKGKRNRKKA